MAHLEDSHVDIAALREFLAASTELASALSDVANKVASTAKVNVETRAAEKKDGILSKKRGVGYKVSTKVVEGRGEENPMSAVITAPAGAFLGTNSGLREQTRAYGHPTSLWHVADHYDLADAASLWEEG